MTDVFMPSMGESVKEGVIINVLVKPGDLLSGGQTLLEVETDKVTFEVPAESPGKLMEIFVKKGDKIRPGDLFVRINSDEATAKEIAQNLIPQDEVANGASTLVVIPEAINKEPLQPTTKFNKNGSGVSTIESKRILSTPLARKLARELNIEIKDIGNSITTRISFRDVKAFAKYRLQQANNKHQNNQFNNLPALPDFEKYGKIFRETIPGIMAATSRNMTLSATVIPHAWIQEKADITDIEAQRKKHKTKVEEAGGNLTITALMVKAVTHSLQLFPIFNSSLDTENSEIVFKDYFHVGVAVDTDRGLLVPVIRDAAQRTLTDIAIELKRVSKEAKERKLKLEDLEGATFTISNLGGIGTTGINPIINWPQVAILGMSAGRIEPVWSGTQFLPRLIMPFTLGFDHRVINGAEAARFLQHLKTILEDPFLLLL